MAYFPLFIEMEGKEILMVGAGRIATRRILLLLEFGASLTVVAKWQTDEILKLASEKRLKLYKRVFEKTDVEGMDFVFTATDVAETENEVYEVCKQKGILVNLASDQKRCDFYFPGVVRQESLVIGVTSGGTDHALVKKTMKRLKEFLTNGVKNETG